MSSCMVGRPRRSEKGFLRSHDKDTQLHKNSLHEEYSGLLTTMGALYETKVSNMTSISVSMNNNFSCTSVAEILLCCFPLKYLLQSKLLLFMYPDLDKIFLLNII